MIDFYNVPFHSQLTEIKTYEWQQQGCGIASLAMAIDYYKPNTVSVNKLLTQAIVSGAYVPNVGWKHTELAALAGKYGLVGKTYDFSKTSNQTAFAELKDLLNDGPVIVSIHNKFDPKATLGHIVVVTGLDEQNVYYNNPALRTPGGSQISIADFLKGWKRRFITVREPETAKISLK